MHQSSTSPASAQSATPAASAAPGASPAEARRGSLKGRRLRRRRRLEEGLVAAAFLLPGLVWFWTWMGYPLVQSFVMSFFRWRIRGASPFIGLENYARALGDPVIRTALENTLIYALFSVPGQMALGFAVAYLLDRKLFGRVAFRLLYYLPVISSWVVVSLIFVYLFHSQGLINYILVEMLGVLKQPVNWLSQRWTALAVICLLGIWKGMGWSMLLFLAALQNIPDEVEEAARIDGARSWAMAVHVKLPLLRPMVLFQLVMLTIGAFQSFIQWYVMTNGGPMNQTQVFLTYMYKQAFSFLDFGYAAAISYLLAALILVIGVIQMRFVRMENQW